MDSPPVETWLVGTWLLVAQHSHYPDGRQEPSRGENPSGILMYDRAGNMAVQLLRTDKRAGEYTDLTALETAMRGFLAYYGRYTVDAEQQIIHHHIAGSSYPGYRGSTQIRRYTLAGDTLTLTAQSTFDDSTRVIVWRRAGSF
jgi:hypothetical protein